MIPWKHRVSPAFTNCVPRSIGRHGRRQTASRRGGGVRSASSIPPWTQKWSANPSGLEARNRSKTADRAGGANIGTLRGRSRQAPGFCFANAWSVSALAISAIAGLLQRSIASPGVQFSLWLTGHFGLCKTRFVTNRGDPDAMTRRERLMRTWRASRSTGRPFVSTKSTLSTRTRPTPIRSTCSTTPPGCRCWILPGREPTALFCGAFLS